MCVLIFHVKDVFIIVLFQPVLLTVIGVILIAVRLPLDDSASDLSTIATPLQTNCQENEEEKEREKERKGEQKRDRPSISTGAGTAFIRSTIGKRETLTGLNFSLIVMTPPHTPPHIPPLVSPSPLTPPNECTMHFFLVSCCFGPSASGVCLFLHSFGVCHLFHNPLGTECSVLWKKHFIWDSGIVCIPPIFHCN